MGMLMLSLVTFSQISDFKLSDYKLPDIKRHQLDLGLNSGSSIRNDNNPAYYDKQDYSNINANFDAAYSFYRNSARYQGQQSIALATNFYYSEQESKPNNNYNGWYSLANSDNKRFNLDFGIQSENRFYLRNENFFEVQLLTQYINDSQNRNNDYQNDFNVLYQHSNDQGKTNYFSVELPIYYGVGRIEQVQDARQSLFILNDMKRVNRLQRTPTHEEIIAMSEKISEVKNKRFFDSRLQKIDELDTINKFLLENGLVTDTDISYFSSMNDMWDFGSRQVRLAGYRVYGGAEPMIEFARYWDKQLDELPSDTMKVEQNTKFKSRRLHFVAGLSYEEPFHQKWQFSLNTKVFLGPASYITEDEYIVDHTENTNNKINTTEFGAELNIGLGFYPNTRTFVSASVGGYYNNDKGTYFSDGLQKISKGEYYDLIPALDAYYYISPKFRLSGNVSYQIHRFKGNNAIDYNLNNYSGYSPIHGWNMLLGENEYKNKYLDFRLTMAYSIF